MKNLFGRNGAVGRMGKAVVMLATVLGLAGLMFISSQRSDAQPFCELPPVAAAGLISAMAAQSGALMAAFLPSQACPGACGALPTAYAFWIEFTQNILINGPVPNTSLNSMEDTILKSLQKFWDNWLLALKDMTAQLSGSLNDGTRHLDSLFDSSVETQNARMLQETEHKAKKQYQTTDEGCRFDTSARYLNSNMRTGSFISQGMTKNMNVQGNNATGSPAAVGQSGVNKSRFATYKSTFCDGVSNNGYPGCAAPGPLPNADTMPAKTLFGKETIDLKGVQTVDKDERAAVEALTYNITGFEVPDPFAVGVLQTSAGKEARAHDREYIAQMDAVSSLVTSLVGERMPSGKQTPEVQKLRNKLGVNDASLYASEREIRQSVIEQLWDPNYWVDLGDSPGSTAQKEVYLRAYNLMMLYKVVEKTEKIANAYAIETANMLDKYHGSVRQGGDESMPVR